MFRSLTLALVALTVVACDDAALDPAQRDLDWDAAAAAERAAALDPEALDQLPGAPIDVPCGKDLVGYTNGTEVARCVNVELLQACEGGDGGRVDARGARAFDLKTKGASVDVSVPAGGEINLICNGFLNAKGCCTFAVSAPVGTCGE